MKKRYLIAFIITLGILWLTNPYWIIFKSKHHASLEFYIFIIILVCGYLLSLKITEYLADFKTLKNQSRIEIIFLTIFFGILFIPMSHIDYNSVASKAENRNLAKYKPLFEKDYKINYNFGNDFNSWFNDRFNYREFIIYFYYKYIKYNIAGEWFVSGNVVYNKKTHWAFRNDLISYDKEFYSKTFLQETINNIDKFNEFCEKNGIKLYILIVPFNNEIYNEHLPHYMYSARFQDNKNRVLYKIKSSSKANIIYPYKKLKKAAKKNQIYFKQEHHWSDLGAYAGYSALMQSIKQDYPNIVKVSLSSYDYKLSKKTRGDWDRKFKSGNRLKNDLSFLKKDKKKIEDVEYLYFDHKAKDLIDLKIINNEQERSKEFYFPQGYDLKVIQIGSSMNENLLQFTPYTFQNLKYYRLNGVKERQSAEEFKIMKYYKNIILDYNPDIIILCITPKNLLTSSQWIVEN